MPYKSEKIIIEKTKHDRRIRLTDEQRKEIKTRYSSGASQRQLAKEFHVSRRLISFIVVPFALQENLKRRAERGGTKVYYDKDKNTLKQKDYRRRKQTLKIEGLI